MTRRDILTCVHEPFGDAFYFGPERLSSRYENDEEARKGTGFEKSTFKTVLEKIEREGEEVRSKSTSSTYPPGCFSVPLPRSQSISSAKF